MPSPTISFLHALALACAPMVIAGVATEGGGAPSPVSRLADSEVARRAALTAKADAEILEARELARQGKAAEALDILAGAHASLPDTPMTLATRSAARDAFCDVGMRDAARLAGEARYGEARVVLQRILDPAMDPEHAGARKFLAELDDPDRFPPAASPEHSAKVAKVAAGLRDAADLLQAARYDDAFKAYEEVSRIDPYNTAARRGMESIERSLMDYAVSARNHTRAKMLREVAQGWEMENPERIGKLAKDALEAAEGALQDTEARNRRDFLARKMKRMIIDQIKIEGQNLLDALPVLIAKSKMADREAQDADSRGVNVVLDIGSEDEPLAKQVLATEITLELRQIPFDALLDYVAKQVGLTVRVEPFAVVLVPSEDAESSVFIRTYHVPPDFIASVPTDTATEGNDPFAAKQDNGGGLALKRLSPKDFLEQSGITFPKNAFVVYDPATSTLSMRNTSANHDLVEGMVEKARSSLTPQIAVESRMIEVKEDTLKELGFDWLLGAFEMGQGVYAAGGSDPGFASNAGFPFSTTNPLTGETASVGSNPITAGNRSGNAAIALDTIDTRINESTISPNSSLRAPGVLSLAGVLSEPRFQVVMRALSQTMGKDFLNAPSVVTRSGMPAHVEVIRDFIYPTEYDQPEIPTSVGNNGNNGGTSTSPVTPANPTAFETTPIGSTLDVEPVVSGDGKIIEVNIETVLREFIGFINYGTPITSALGTRPQDTVVVTPNRILQPVFETRRLKTSASVYDGQTLVLGGLTTEQGEGVEDKTPGLGDVPILGRFFKTKANDRNRKVLLIFVKVDTLDPSGKPVRDALQSSAAGL